MMNQFSPILFDTSIWIKLIKENISPNEWASHKVIPFLPLEVVLELINVDTDTRKQRLTYLASIPQIAILPYSSKIEIGGIINLISLEYLYKASKIEEPFKLFLKEKIKTITGLELISYNFQNATDNDLDFFLNQSKSKNAILANPMMREPHLWKKRLSDFPIEKVFDERQIPSIKPLLDARLYKRESENDPSFCKDFFIKYAQSLANEGLLKLIKKYALNVSQDMLISDFSRSISINILLQDISAITNIPLDILKGIDFRTLTILNILDVFDEEYSKEYWRDQRRKIESSSYMDKILAAYSSFLPVMVDARTHIIMDQVKARGFDLDYFQAGNFKEFFERLEKFAKKVKTNLKHDEQNYKISV